MDGGVRNRDVWRRDTWQRAAVGQAGWRMGRLIVAGVATIVIIVIGSLAVWDEYRTQQGIDARKTVVTAEVVQFNKGRDKSHDTYDVVYLDGSSRRVKVYFLPSETRIGERVCLEIDSAHPDAARLCGTRGDLPSVLGTTIFASGSMMLLTIIMVLVTRRRMASKAMLLQRLSGQTENSLREHDPKRGHRPVPRRRD